MPIGINPPTISTVVKNVPSFSGFQQSDYKFEPWDKKIGNAFTAFFDKVGGASKNTAVNNLTSGDLDYQRAIEQAEAHRQFSSSEAQKLRDWQEKMSNTAYSRAVKDLKSVGINPYAIGGFNAASTPSGAYGQSSVASGYGNLMSNSTGALTSIASSAISAIALIASKGKLNIF